MAAQRRAASRPGSRPLHGVNLHVAWGGTMARTSRDRVVGGSHPIGGSTSDASRRSSPTRGFVEPPGHGEE